MLSRLARHVPARLLISFGLYEYLSNVALLEYYKKIGHKVGSMIFDRHLGVPVGYHGMLKKLISIEYLVVQRGFRSIPMYVFTYARKEDLYTPKRVPGEKPIYFASLWNKVTSKKNIFGDFLAQVMGHQAPLIANRVDDDDIFIVERKVLAMGPIMNIKDAS